MTAKKTIILSVIGICTGFVTGILGGGGGMVLLPMLTLLPDMEESSIFPSSVAIILPICIISILFAWPESPVSWTQLTPYLLGSFLGGLSAGSFGRRIPTLWLHRVLGILILWGGIRYLWQTTS